MKRKTAWLRIGEILFVFALLLLAARLVTQQANAPQLILLLLLYIIAINFSLPPEYGGTGLAPVVAVSSFLLTGLNTAILLTTISFIIAELARPLWHPMWDSVNLKKPGWWERIGTILIHVLSLILSSIVYRWLGGNDPLTNVQITEQLWAFAGLTISYGFAHLLLSGLLWVMRKRPLRDFLNDLAPGILTTNLLAQPFAILGGITFVSSGMPLFVVFCMGVTLFSIMSWLSWQRRFIARRQLTQFARLNEASISLREELSLLTVIERTYREVADLIPADEFTIWLLTENGHWQRPLSPRPDPAETPDDFTRWVASNQRLLNLHPQNLHYATAHQLSIPQPPPAAWLGVPLLTSARTTGVMVLQRFGEKQPFGRWYREVLLAIAGQVSAAIENARLYEETLRLYNQTDAALAQRLEQLQALLNTVQEGVLMIDVSGRILLVNPMAARLLQQPVADLHRQPLSPQLAVAHLGFTPAAWQQRREQLRQQIPPEVSESVFQVTLPEPDGHATAYFERTEAAVYDQQEQLIGWLLVLRDVTEEQQLADKRTDLIRMIVHDLRNPVTTVMSTVRAVSNRLSATPETNDVAGLLQDAQQSCNNMLDMVDSLMDINRMEAGQLEPDAEAMRLPPLVERITQRLQPLARQRQISLKIEIAPDLPPVWADADMVRRVLVNLLDNGLKFTPAGGMVRLDVTADTAVSGHDPGVRCSISDTGPGIPPEFQTRVFDRFMRTNVGGAQVRGTGLGLTFCKIAVEAHHGQIWAEAAPGGGSRFIFTLPGIPHFD